MSITAKLLALFNPKPVTPIRFEPSMAMPVYNEFNSKPRWVSTIEQPQPDVPFLIINRHKGWGTETRHGEDSFEFNDDDVCWCYQREFNRYIPDFLMVGVNESDRGDLMPGVAPKPRPGS